MTDDQHKAFLLEAANLGEGSPKSLVLRFWQITQNGLSLYGDPVILEKETANELKSFLESETVSISPFLKATPIIDDDGNSGKNLIFTSNNITVEASIGNLAVQELIKDLSEKIKDL